MRILIVEDDETISGFLAKGLAEAGFTVDRETEGRKGLERALETTYDVAIVDVMAGDRDDPARERRPRPP